MLNYGYLLKSKEKDNPSSFCRNSYLFSNVGDLVYCYGRILRFPKDRNIYLAEIKLALGDILMQCRIKEYEFGIKRLQITDMDVEGADIEKEIRHIAFHAGEMQLINKELEISQTIAIILGAYAICYILGWNPEEIEHLGYQHVMERFEQFKEDGWK
jgi:DNA-binding CsgD family transcriptional regulator